jgi:chemotaxis protein MotB
MADDKPLIVVKRKRKVAGGAHGGAWKIAYADFVTAMMAFFLLLWLLSSSVSKRDLEGIAGYFKTPIEKIFVSGENKSGTSSVIPGGGQDLTRKEGEVMKGSAEFQVKPSDKSRGQQKLLDEAGLKALKEKIEKAIQEKPQLKNYKNQVLIDITDQGLRIQIVDDLKRPMFALSSAELEPFAKAIMRAVGSSLNGISNKVSLSGHTDAIPFSDGPASYSNWELSTDRANASRRELIQGGMEEGKVLEVVGLGSAVLYDKTNPINPINRRISIIILNKKTQDRIEKNASVVANNTEATKQVIEESGSKQTKK